MSKKVYDFSGWATKTDLKCSDGRTIKENAFADQDGVTVPLVWSHQHGSQDNVLGHALLENRRGGVYCYCSFNDTQAGKTAKELVRHGDIASLSIFANKLKQNGGDVVHGAIKEVSLVLAGANPGALIDNVIAHGEENEEEAEIYLSPDQEFLMDVELEHEDSSEETVEETTTENEEELEHACCGDSCKKKKKLEHAKDEETKDVPMEEVKKEKTVQEIVDGMTEEQKNVLYYMVGKAAGIEDEAENMDEAKHEDDNKEDGNVMKNAFENQNVIENENEKTLSHEDLNAIMADAARKGDSLKHAMEEAGYAGIMANDNELAHSVTNISNFFPEVKAVNNPPLWNGRRQEWVNKVLGAVHHTPFSRIKSTYADITADAARAKGYVTGAQKAEEVIVALKRTTTPTTVYKLQKLDRDDILDITDFDIVPWIKSEMRVMLDEELARAILIGDGRTALHADKINETNIRPILGDNSTYTISKILTKAAGDTEYTFAKDFIREVVKSRIDYKGSGEPTLFVTELLLTDMLLIEDTNGHRLYKTMAELAAACRCKEIVSVPVFQGVTRAGSGATAGYNFNLMGVMVNLTDYNVGADKGGQVSLFDDFDINYNKYEYLIETRCSGALVVPYSAVTFEEKVAAQQANG